MFIVNFLGWIFILITVISITFGLFCWFSKKFFFHNKLEDIQINKPNLWIGLLLILAILIVLFAFLAPVLFTDSSSYRDFDTSTGAVGDTIGGIMNPFIAIAAVIVTGLAFYMQYQANEQARHQFYKGLQEQRKQFEESLEYQKTQFEKQLSIESERQDLNKFESQFYEMLRLHKENVNEMEIEGYEIKERLSDYLASDCYSEESFRKSIDKSKGGHNLKKPLMDQDLNKKQVKGRKIFYLMTKEISAVYQVIKKHYYSYCPKEFSVVKDDLELIGLSKYILFSFAYDVFFSGKEQLEKDIKFKTIQKIMNDERNNDQFHKDILKDLQVLRTCHKKGIRYLKEFNSVVGFKRSLHLDFSYKPFGGHQIRLAHYYRHMFALVKFVVNQSNKLLSYEDKRQYLKIFRAQLSNHEVVMLYYNWLGGYGEAWETSKHKKEFENKGNKYFTDFRVLHNLNSHLVLGEFKPEELFKNHGYNKFLYKDVEKVNDLLFEVHGIESSLTDEEIKRLKNHEQNNTNRLWL